jgi:predicted ATP-grasp superfamily ATP-dependent carboligase
MPELFTLPKEDDNHRVLVVTSDTFIGLSVIRSLGRKGIRVIAITSDEEGIGHYSRYCYKSIKIAKSKDGTIVEKVLDLARRDGVSHLIPTSEDWIVIFNEYRSLLESQVQLLFPKQDIFELALYKDKTLQLAQELGIPIPRTEYINNLEDIRKCADMRFPVILKPRQRDIRLGQHGRLNFKIEYVYSYEELVQKMDAFCSIGECPLVQEYCEGRGVGVEMLMRKGNPLALFQHRRIREYPPRGGVSVFCESVPLNPTLVDYSIKLLQAMQWDGVAMVEFRYDDKTGHAVLMEVNGRFWGSLPLAIHAGMDFPYLLYKSSFTELKDELGGSYKVGIRCRAATGDAKWLLAMLREGLQPRVKTLHEYLVAFKPGVKYYAWALDDPIPALMNSLLRLRRLRKIF